MQNPSQVGVCQGMQVRVSGRAGLLGACNRLLLHHLQAGQAEMPWRQLAFPRTYRPAGAGPRQPLEPAP